MLDRVVVARGTGDQGRERIVAIERPHRKIKIGLGVLIQGGAIEIPGPHPGERGRERRAAGEDIRDHIVIGRSQDGTAEIPAAERHRPEKAGRARDVDLAVHLNIECLVEIHPPRAEGPVERLRGLEERGAAHGHALLAVAPTGRFVGAGEQERLHDHALAGVGIADERSERLGGAGHERRSARDDRGRKARARDVGRVGRRRAPQINRPGQRRVVAAVLAPVEGAPERGPWRGDVHGSSDTCHGHERT